FLIFFDNLSVFDRDYRNCSTLLFNMLTVIHRSICFHISARVDARHDGDPPGPPKRPSLFPDRPAQPAQEAPISALVEFGAQARSFTGSNTFRCDGVGERLA